MDMSKKLYRSKSDQKLAGICGGIAEYFHIDSTLVRVIMALGSLYGLGDRLLYYLHFCHSSGAVNHEIQDGKKGFVPLYSLFHGIDRRKL